MTHDQLRKFYSLIYSFCAEVATPTAIEQYVETLIAAGIAQGRKEGMEEAEKIVRAMANSPAWRIAEELRRKANESAATPD